MGMLPVLLLLVAFFLGSLPLGHWLLLRAGVSTRLNNPHYLGLENLFQRVGLRLALGSSALDFAKGLFAVVLAASLQINEVTVTAVLAAYLGHLNPPNWLYGSQTPRGRGNLLLLGALSGLAITASLPYWLALLPVVVYAAVVGYWGYMSTATLVALTSLTLLAALSDLGTGGKIALFALTLAALWRFKENIGRVLDGTEPRVGEDVPLAGKREDAVVAAFMIHPMGLEDLWQSRRFSWMKPLIERGLITEKTVRQFADEFRPMKIGELRGIRTVQGKEIHCYLLTCPLLPDRFKDDPDLALKRAIEGARLAHELGAEVFGLGAFWSVIGEKGSVVQDTVPEITVTNGGAYTSGTIKAAIPQILQHFDNEGRSLSQATAAVVGANGVVAFGIARTIAPQVKKLIMLGRDQGRLDRSATSLRRRAKDTEIVTTTNYHDLREADLVFSATSDPKAVIFAQHIKEGTWIFDEGRPADVDDSAKQVAGVRVIPGGVVKPPGDMSSNIDLRFGEGAIPACLAETLMIAATGEHQRKSLGGHTSSEDVEFFVEQAAKMGFEVLD